MKEKASSFFLENEKKTQPNKNKNQKTKVCKEKALPISLYKNLDVKKKKKPVP